jgi:hypothetical protein
MRGLATWVLDRLVGDDALLGDLVEQHRSGRSLLWFWRQVLLALVLAGSRTLFSNGPLLARSAVIASAALWLWVQATWWAYLWVHHNGVDQWALESQKGSGIFYMFWIAYGGGLSLVWCVGAALSGWMVVRNERAHPVAVAIACVVPHIFLALWWGLPMWRNLAHTEGTRYWLPNLLVILGVLVAMPLSTLAVAIWSASRRARTA